MIFYLTLNMLNFNAILRCSIVQSHQTMTYMAPNFMSLHATRLVNFLRLEIILNIFESQYHIK